MWKKWDGVACQISAAVVKMCLLWNAFTPTPPGPVCGRNNRDGAKNHRKEENIQSYTCPMQNTFNVQC